MLDNIATETRMAAMPVEILADARVCQQAKSNKYSEDQIEIEAENITNHAVTAAPAIKSNKTKTILNWLKYNTNNNTLNTNTSGRTNKTVKADYREAVNSGNHNRSDKQLRVNSCDNCTCPKIKPQNNTNSHREPLTTPIHTPTKPTTTATKSLAHKDDDTLREFRGVQTLKHFWNKRITANRESALRAKGSKHQFTKSVSCLVNVINNTGEPPPPTTTASHNSPTTLSEKELLLKSSKLRALSLYDCSGNLTDFDEISLSDIDIQKHLEKDNFYKYKTAEQASKLRELSEHSTHKKLSNGIILPVDWLKRHEKFSRKKSIELTLSSPRKIRKNTTNNSDNSHQLISATSAENNNDATVNENKMYCQQLQQDMACLPKALGQNTGEVGKTNQSNKNKTPTSTPTANSPQHAVSHRRETTRKDSAKNLASVSSISRDSSTTSLAASANSLKSVVKRNSSAARKYSFKTHTRSYHASRKMHTNKETVSGATGMVGSAPNSLVAKLTQQFNEIIQKDKTLLDEIKRKNGVLMTHKGHVYKVVDTSSLNRNHSPQPTVSHSRSREADTDTKSHVKHRTGSSTVQRNIKKFESESRGLKPKVPLKSLQVLRKSNELVVTKAISSGRPNSNRLIQTKDAESKADVKPQTLPLPQTLEMVQEEAKTPVENSDRRAVGEIKSPNNSEKVYQQDSSCLAGSSSPEDIIQQDKVIYKSIIRKSLQEKVKEIKRAENTPENSKEQPLGIATYAAESSVATSQPEDENKDKFDEHQSQNGNEESKLDSSCTKDDHEHFSEVLENKLIETGSNKDVDIHSETAQREPPSSPSEKSETDTTEKPPENSASPEPMEDEDKKKRKHKYAKIYEKLRFFTPFAHTSKKQKLTTTTSPNGTDVTAMETIAAPPLTVNTDIIDSKSDETAKEMNSVLCENPKLLRSGEYTPMSSPTPRQESEEPSDDVYSVMYNPDAKLLDALEQVDRKLQNLSQDNDKTLESDEYGGGGPPFKPNPSLLPQAKEVMTPKPSALIQAVNVTLVNAIEGEQMIMEQKEIQQERIKEQQIENNSSESNILPLVTKSTEDEEEPFYEPICVDKTIEIKTEQSSGNCEFINKTIENNTEDSSALEEDIYQTVEEAKSEDMLYNISGKGLESVTKCSQQLDGYEPIENPDDAKLPSSINDSSAKTVTHFDGYEEYTPAVEIAPLPPPITTTTGVRRVTDELPDLPKPKRVLPKSPKSGRSVPKPPLLRLESTDEDSLTSRCQDPNYYGAEENIYDTIKSSHCYESLQSVMDNKLQNSPPLLRSKTSDCVSLTSNCYESISHYKRTHNNVVGHHSGGSSNGSTLTISSENKTNSLYEDSLNSSLHYASKRIYHTNARKANEINKYAREVNSVNGYGSSLGRTTDTSDEWTDVSDNENDDTENKPQFIIVRERSKAHKSPDWSKRVRDKRQRKSKSCIEDDDPDHFYEQLSPLALSKRHSLLEHTRTNSLQRNTEAVRVSQRGKKMSYSAHALGQHISDDSFESDTDDYYESGHFKNAHNDSGVDIRNTKLPDPPTSSNQVYSFVKKFKNFIVNKKSPNSSKQKLYESSSSQFYSGGQYESKAPQQPTSSLQVPETKELSTSEKNLILAQSAVSAQQHPVDASTTPRKSKSGKSLRSRLRKSLVGFDNKQLSTLTPTRSTFYIEDPANYETNGQLDSGFSEKTLSGELPTSTSTPSAESQKLSTLARKSKKEAKLNNSQRRRTTIGIRPHEPPPPPPPDSNAKPRRQSNTSWYAECGVFKNGTTNLVNDEAHILNSQSNSSGGSFTAGSTWYEEAGLYQTSGLSVASSSGSSGVSTSNETGPADEMSHSMFSNEPLYQIYSAAKLEAISRDMQDESSTDGYEEIGERLKNGNATEAIRKPTRPSALQLVEPKGGPERTLWSQIPEVINSYIIPTMTPRERALMEAKFEIITSEASYLKSLNLLRTHYMNHPVFRDQNVVSSRDRKSLFAHIVPVHECSEKLLTELESCWQDNIMLIGLSKRIYAVAEKHFHVYVGFCEHQGRMDRTLKHLREGKGLFAQNLELLESSPACCGLNLHSFLMLPMQRITRLPLLIDAVFSKCHPNDDEYENWKMCLAIMNKIVTQCNEAANKSEQAFEIERISRQLEFNPSVIRPLAIAPAGVLAPGTKPRYLVKKGELTHLIWRGDDAKLTFGKKFSKSTVFAFLFSDLLVLTKRKAEEQFSVFDYCPRNMLTITSGDSLPQLPTKDLNSQTSKNLILMTLLENHERKTVELLLSCPSVSEQERWLQTMRPPESETPGEKLYEQWDCPQVIAKHLYENNEPDVLNLDVGDVVNVTRKLPDGWYKGERIRDGAVGWFPGSYTEEVNSVHVRARNLKQRHRLLTFTATYLESQKRNK